MGTQMNIPNRIFLLTFHNISLFKQYNVFYLINHYNMLYEYRYMYIIEVESDSKL